MAGRKRSVTIDFLADTKDAKRGMKIVSKEAQTTGEKFSGMGKTVKYAMGAVATGAVVQFGREMAVHAARMDAIEQRTDTVFGNMADDIRSWAGESAGAFGLSENGVLNLASAFGDLLVPMGFTREETAKMTKETLTAANALSEWTGGQVSVETAAEAVQKAMLGEREMLKTLGISILEADVKQRLLEKGQDDLTGSAKQQAKAIATQELIFEKSADALDSYAEGGNEALKSQKELSSTVAELKDDLSQTLQPAVQSVVSGLSDFASGAQVLLDWFNNLSPAMKNAALAIGGLSAALALLYANPAIAGLALVAGAIIKIGQDAKKAEERVGSLKDVLSDVAEQDFGDATRNWLRSQFEEIPEFEENLARFGVTFEELETAVMEGGDAIDDLRVSMEDSATSGDFLSFRLSGTQAEVSRLADTVIEATEAVQEERRAEIDLAVEQANQRRGRADLADKIRMQEDATEDVTEATDEEAEAHRELKDAILAESDARRAAADPVFALFDALTKHNDAMAELNRLQEEGKTDTDEYTEAQLDLIAAQGDLTGAWNEIALDGPEAIDVFREMAAAAGLSGDEIDELIGSILTYNQTPIDSKRLEITGAGAARVVTTASGEQLHAFDTGGVVPGPRGKPRLVVAHGGETILPTHKNRSQGMGGPKSQTIIVEIDGKVLAQAMMDPMAEQIRLRTGTRR